MKFLSSLSALGATALLSASQVSALFPYRNTLPPDTEWLDHQTLQNLQKRGYAFNGWGTFDQLIDHSNPKLGTFKQRYWYGTEFWNGPGSPIFLMNMGETSAENYNVSYLSEHHLPGRMAEEMGGAVILMEHRYWGESSPYDLLTVKNLSYLTLDNSLKDITYLAKNLKLPFDSSDASHPSNAPWIYMGGSYPGAIAAWLAVREPGTFWAYYSSSGVVQAITDFWQYYVPIEEATPRNCSSDISAVINYVDSVLISGTAKQKDDLKAKFYLSGLTDADFAEGLARVIWQWQKTQFDTEAKEGSVPYFDFCDYVEGVWPNSTAKVPGKEGVGLTKALEGYSKYYREVMVPYCKIFFFFFLRSLFFLLWRLSDSLMRLPDTDELFVIQTACEAESDHFPSFKGKYNVGCFQSSNASHPAYKELTVDNLYNRQWTWMLCNEPFEWWFSGAPKNHNNGKTLVSRLINKDHWRNLCKLHFPGLESGVAKGKTAADVNKFTGGGWNVVNTTRVMHTNGQHDPWRDATISSVFREGGEFKGSEQVPVRMIKGGGHCSDLSKAHWDRNEGLLKVVDEVLWNMKVWVAEFYGEKVGE